jgi:hypothetical protein
MNKDEVIKCLNEANRLAEGAYWYVNKIPHDWAQPVYYSDGLKELRRLLTEVDKVTLDLKNKIKKVV